MYIGESVGMTGIYYHKEIFLKQLVVLHVTGTTIDKTFFNDSVSSI